MDGISLLVLAVFGLLQIFTDLCRRKTRMLSRATLVFGLLCLGHLLGCFDETLKMSVPRGTPKRAVPTPSPMQNQSIILFLTPPAYGVDPLWFIGKELSNPFAGQRCVHSRCVISSDPRLADRASLVVFHGPFGGQCCEKKGQSVNCSVGISPLKQSFAVPKASPKRAVMFYQREAPARTERKCLEALDDAVNYTWSYKRSSDIFFPYGRVERLATNVSKKPDDRGVKSYARNVLWYVSNCRGTIHARSRYEYAVALSKYIDVDIYGQCSGRSDGCVRGPAGEACRRKQRSLYRFYLAFENSHCDEYVTEKFFEALQQGNVPIVRGLPKRKYQAVAPPNSFIHADDFDGPASLARYLRWLAASGDRIARYHDWRRSHVVRDEAKDLCKLCELATLRPARTVRLSRWWSKEGNCLP